MSPRWFAVRCLFRSFEAAEVEPGCYEERIFLFSGGSMDEAADKARAREPELSYQNARGKKLTVRFDAIVDTFELVEDAAGTPDGLEVYSVFLTPDAAALVRSALRTRFEDE